MRNFIEKQRNILDFTLSSLLRRRSKNFALIVVYTLVVFSLGSVMFFTQALRKEAGIILRETPEIIVQRLVAGRQDLIPVDYAQKISRIRGVSAVKGRLWGYYFDPVARVNYTLMVPADAADWGNNLSVGEGFLKAAQTSIGEIFSLRDYTGHYLNFRIRGVFSNESALVSSDLILLSDFAFRRLFGIAPEQATDLVVTVRNKKEIPTIAAKILELLPDTRPILRDEILRTYDAAFDWRGGIILVVLAGSVFAFLIFA